MGNNLPVVMKGCIYGDYRNYYHESEGKPLWDYFIVCVKGITDEIKNGHGSAHQYSTEIFVLLIQTNAKYQKSNADHIAEDNSHQWTDQIMIDGILHTYSDADNQNHDPDLVDQVTSNKFLEGQAINFS